MYDLGDRFKFDLNKSTANNECVFKGNKYRITVLTERLVRLEYSENGIFEDYPTELVWYRNFDKPKFTVEENNKIIKITTKYFELTYLKEKKFYGGKISPANNLKIELKNSDRVWYYGHPEIRNFGASAYKTIHDKNKRIQRSLYSLDGFASIDDSNSSIILENGVFKKRENKEIDIYVFLYNKDFYYCLNDYFAITGYPPLIPRYALGNWWDKNQFYNEFDIAHIVKKFETNNIPISVFILSKWQNNNNFEFSENYKNPKTIIDYLHNKNIKVGLSIDDPIRFSSKSKDIEKLKNYLSVDKNGNIPFNIYNDRTIDAFLKLIIHPLDNLGIDFYSLNTFDKNNLERLMILKHYLYYDAFRIPNKRPLVNAHNSTIAAHRYPVVFAGKSEVSWETLKNIPTFNGSASNLGVSFWSHDFGGTTGGVEDNELYTRFIELGVFSPILKLGSDESKYYKRAPWKWGIKTSKIVTDYLNLRYKLIPYIYTESYKYFKYGKPLIEPVYYRYPSLYDDTLYCNEYYFGAEFFISPIISKKDYVMNRVIHKLYLPDGVWYDFFTGKRFLGNRKYVSFYKDEDYPVFVKAGTIVPMSLNGFNDTSVPKKMEIQVFPGANNTYSIYEDDGTTNNYLNGDYVITNVEYVYQKNNYKLTILPVGGKVGIIPKTRDYKIRFKNTKPASKILSYIGSTQVRNTSYKDDTDLIVELENIPTTEQLTILVSGEDIEIDAIRIISDDIISIISDLPIKTIVKQKIDDIMFSKEYDLKKKKIEIRKLANGKNYIEKKYIDLLLKLLEYINEI